jgi:hypothetical protein
MRITHAIGDRDMGLASLAEHTGAVGGIAAGAILAIRYGSDAVLRLVAGITAIAAHDEEQSRAQRALDVLNTVSHKRGDRPLVIPKHDS